MTSRIRTLLIVLFAAWALVAITGAVGFVAFRAGQRSAALREAAPAAAVAPTVSAATEVVATPSPAPSPTSPAAADAPPQQDGVTPDVAPVRPTTVPTSEPVLRDPVNLTPEGMRLLFEVWDLVNREYDGPLPSDEEALYGAIRGSLDLLGDPFTRFVPPAVAAQSREQLDGSYEGIGAFVDMDERGLLIIVRPFVGQPAAEAGLRSGDVITHVDGEAVAGKSLEEIIARVKGPIGTEVTLTVVREGVEDPFDLRVERARIEIPIVESEMLAGDIAYVRLSTFSSSADQILREALEDLLAQDPRALILDLRDNPGGFLNQATAVADLFLDEGVILYQRNSNGVEEIFTSRDGELAEHVPLVVLVNVGSASASEIVAGAIQDRGRGTVVGEQTFGKGSVQQSHTLSDGSELRVTIARWYTPNNLSISEVGVSPDIDAATPETFGGPADTQLQSAIDFILGGG
jgi:carboxyl-terminal processing protease